MGAHGPGFQPRNLQLTVFHGILPRDTDLMLLRGDKGRILEAGVFLEDEGDIVIPVYFQYCLDKMPGQRRGGGEASAVLCRPLQRREEPGGPHHPAPGQRR